MDMKDVCINLGADIINPERNYWLVRTKGGRFFDDFYFKGYVAIGWNMVDVLSTDQREKKELKEYMKKCVSEHYSEEKISGKPAGQIYRFVKEMKKGDIVLVPNADSKFIAFGEIESDSIYREEIENEDIDLESLEKALLYNGDEEFIEESLKEIGCPFEKRRKVRWLKELDRNDLDSNLYALLNSHGTISDANKYAYAIDRELSSFYIKGEKAHLVYNVTTQEDVPAIDLLDFVYSNLNLIDVYNKLYDTDISKKSVMMKVNVQSPGPIDLQGDIAGVAIIALLGVFIVGGSAKCKKDKDGNFEAEVGSKGIIEQVTNLIRQKGMEDRLIEIEKGLNETKDKLKIKSPNLNTVDSEIALEEDSQSE